MSATRQSSRLQIKAHKAKPNPTNAPAAVVRKKAVATKAKAKAVKTLLADAPHAPAAESEPSYHSPAADSDVASKARLGFWTAEEYEAAARDPSFGGTVEVCDDGDEDIPSRQPASKSLHAPRITPLSAIKSEPSGADAPDDDLDDSVTIVRFVRHPDPDCIIVDDARFYTISV